MSDNPTKSISQHHGFHNDADWPHGDKPRRVHSGEVPPARLEAVPEHQRSDPFGVYEVKTNNRGEVIKIERQKARDPHPFGEDMAKMTNHLRDGSSPGPADDK
jgi:hypothetical protein